MNDNLRRFAILALVVFMAADWGWAYVGMSKHLDTEAADQIVDCVDASLKLRTLVYHDFLGSFSKIQCTRGQSREQTIKNIEEQHFRILSNDQWAFLVPDDLFTGNSRPFKVAWKTLQVDIDIVVNPDSSEQPPEDQISCLKEALLTNTRLIPVQADSLDPEHAIVKLRYQIEETKTKRGKTAIVALLREGDAYESFGRVIYVTSLIKPTEIGWDSPLVFVNGETWNMLQDVDGDGVDEIVVQATIGFGAHGPGWDTITIFDQEGREMTKMNDCRWMDRTEFKSGAGRVCPISGRELTLQVDPETSFIRVSETPKGGDAVYVLRNEHFVLDKNVK